MEAVEAGAEAGGLGEAGREAGAEVVEAVEAVEAEALADDGAEAGALGEPVSLALAPRVLEEGALAVVPREVVVSEF